MSDKLNLLMNAIHYEFKNESLLTLALSHRSSGKQNNERLEFLGDSLLNFVVASELYHQFPTAKEGQLSRLRANMVREDTLAEIGTTFHLSDYIQLGVGEMKSGGAYRPSIVADAVEAVIGAIYLDSNLDVCYECVKNWYEERIDALSLSDVIKDPKSRLQELLQAQQLPLPEYNVVKTKGQEHEQVFIVECKTALLDHSVFAEGGSRRKAEQEVAEKVLEELKNGSPN